MIFDLAVIGAGMSGLAAAIRGAMSGKKVVLLERHTRIGGLNSYYFRQGQTIDVGLHALTNFYQPRQSTSPLFRVLRQLRISYEELQLLPHRSSVVSFPDQELVFSNQREQLLTEIAQKFPAEIDNFMRLIEWAKEYPLSALSGGEYKSARAFLPSIIKDRLLQEMLLFPIMFYGSSWEDDIDLEQFAILFKSIFLEGLSRPKGGVRVILQILQQRLYEEGCELRLGREVVEVVDVKDVSLLLKVRVGAQTEEVFARKVISCAGYLETDALFSKEKVKGMSDEVNIAGKISFTEAIWCCRRTPAWQHAVVFFSKNNQSYYRRPPGLIDTNSGLICFPDNFGEKNEGSERTVRLSLLANFDLWHQLAQSSQSSQTMEYQEAKQQCEAMSVALLRDYFLRQRLDQGPYQGLNQGIDSVLGEVIFRDFYTPWSIHRYTGRVGGAVYGCQKKFRDGRTTHPNLYLCGTDHGLLGVVGALLSGITVANQYIVAESAL
ncbi:MAG: NAD(P)/FAD-dependent oxidoreductase [Oligoflexia bacterium]|nr:NAD(P)/FAD-dependent oxidoreductase [Oligoflexia bacterium]